MNPVQVERSVINVLSLQHYGKQNYKVATAQLSSEVLTKLIVTVYCLLGCNANKSGTNILMFCGKMLAPSERCGGQEREIQSSKMRLISTRLHSVTFHLNCRIHSQKHTIMPLKFIIVSATTGYHLQRSESH